MDKKSIILAVKNTTILSGKQKKVLEALVSFSVNEITEMNLNGLEKYCKFKKNGIYSVLKVLEERGYIISFKKHQQAYTGYKLNVDRLNYLMMLDYTAKALEIY